MAAPPGLPSEVQLAALTAAPIALSVEAEQAAADAATALQALEAARTARAAAKRRQREAADAALESAEHRHASEREAADQSTYGGRIRATARPDLAGQCRHTIFKRRLRRKRVAVQSIPH